MSASETVIFLHIPKAAGTTLHAILERQYRAATILNVHTKAMEPLLGMPMERRRSIGLIKGHMPFGVHAHVPRPCTYVTVLRRPYERIVSHYCYAARRPDHYVRQRASGRELSLEAYVFSGITHEVDNGQVRLLSGHDDDLPYGACARGHLEEAKRHLEQHFAVVGLTDRFDATLILMQHALGWARAPCYGRRNVRSSPAPSVPAALRSRIEQLNALDMELYEHGTRLFERALLEVPSFEQRYRRFRRRLRLLGPCLTLAYDVKQRLDRR